MISERTIPGMFLLVLVICVSSGASYKILVSILTPATSHYNQGKAIADILHERGHEVTFMTGFPMKKLPYREVFIPEAAMDDYPVGFDISKNSYIEKFIYVKHVQYFVKMMTDNAIKSETLHEFLDNKEEKFDLVIIDYLLNDVLFGLAVRYNCPLIVLSPAPMLHWLARITGNPVSPATVPNFFLDFTSKMNLMERTVNTLMVILEEYYGQIVYDPYHEELYKTYFSEEEKRVSFSELKRSISVVFSNTYPSLGSPRPYLPNIVEIGGFHVAKVSPLPKEYKDILDNAKNGVIFFSMGSYLKTHTMPKPMRDILLKSLSKLKQTVLWKFETELEDLPKNVIIKKWMPQTSILAHTNVELFISHGGILSITEAAMSGVPLIVFPVIADQYFNAKVVEKSKTGISMTFDKLTEESFDTLLNELLNNKTYYDNAKKLQKVYMDRPISARDLVGYYSEHVIKTGGAKHLSPPHLNLASSLLLDVIAILLIPPLLLLSVLYCVCKRICCGKKAEKSKQQKQKKN